jgi:PAS domain S-box-containing protein
MAMEYAEADLARLARFVTSHFELLAQERGIEFRVETPATLPAQVDPEKLQRVLLNLLANAFKFTPSGGRVELALRAAGECAATGATAPLSPRAVIEVRDTGPGVPPEQREAIFERFRQIDGGANRKWGGAGLGLAIAREFVGLHGGVITVEDAPGGGALFRVELPLAAPQGSPVRCASGELEEEMRRGDGRLPVAVDAPQGPSRVGKPAKDHPHAARGDAAVDAPLVLIVEDNPDMNAFVAETLAGGYRVATAFDGQEGLEKALALRPDLILSDVMMPRMSGDRMVRELRRHRELDGVPILLLTARADDELRVKLLKEGAQDCLSKPFSVEELRARVGRLIAERKRSEEALRAYEARTAAILAAALDAIITMDHEGKLVELNPAAEKIFGYSRAEAIGKPLAELIIPERLRDAHRKGLANFLATGDGPVFGERLEMPALRADGTEIPVELVVTQLPTDGPPLFTGFLRDVTERRRVEQSLTQRAWELTRSNAELEQFVYVASHDLQEPLRMVASFTQLLAKRYKGRFDADADEFIGYVVDGASRMQRLIDDLLTFSRVGRSGQSAAPTDSAAVFQAACANLRTAIQESRAVVTSDALPAVMADEMQLVQLFQNLIGNAIKFRGDRPVHVHVGAERQESDWLFWVRDNGIGIEPQYAERIFTIFQRLHGGSEYSGTGIGLAICKKIVERHGGRIWVTSEPEQGSTFYFTLPAQEGKQP